MRDYSALLIFGLMLTKVWAEHPGRKDAKPYFEEETDYEFDDLTNDARVAERNGYETVLEARDDTCNGVPNVDWSCCSSSNPCDIGGGDCDRDSDCTGNLTCGYDNCQTNFATPGSNWGRYADCCEGNERIHAQ